VPGDGIGAYRAVSYAIDAMHKRAPRARAQPDKVNRMGEEAAVGGALTRRRLLSMIGSTAGSAAMYQAMRRRFVPEGPLMSRRRAGAPKNR